MWNFLKHLLHQQTEWRTEWITAELRFHPHPCHRLCLFQPWSGMQDSLKITTLFLCKVQLPCRGMQWHLLHVFRWWGMCKLRLCALGLQRRTTISTSPKMMWSQFWSSRRTGGWESSVGLRGGSPKPMLQCWAPVIHKQSKYHAEVVVMLLLSFLT